MSQCVGNENVIPAGSLEGEFIGSPFFLINRILRRKYLSVSGINAKKKQQAVHLNPQKIQRKTFL